MKTMTKRENAIKMYNQPSDEELLRLYLSLEEETEDTKRINRLFKVKDSLQEAIDEEIQKLPKSIIESEKEEDLPLSEEDIASLWEQFEQKKAGLRNFYMERVLPVLPDLENVTSSILIEEVIQYLVEYPFDWIYSFVDSMVSESDLEELLQELEDRYYKYEDLRDGIIEAEMRKVEGDLA